jgi:hypothetical protein
MNQVVCENFILHNSEKCKLIKQSLNLITVNENLYMGMIYSTNIDFTYYLIF